MNVGSDNIMITFATDKCLGLTDRAHSKMEGNTTAERKDEASIHHIPSVVSVQVTYKKTSFRVIGSTGLAAFKDYGLKTILKTI
jgi:hypothetical protein